MPFLRHGIRQIITANSMKKGTTVVARRTLFTKPSSASSNPVKTALYSTAFVLSAGIFAVYYFDSRSALHRYFLTPVIRNVLDAEAGHKVAVKALRTGLAPKDAIPDDERLGCQVWDERLSNPIGIAAGFDKDGEAIDGLFDLGYSWVEIGSVTPKPQPGNPKPRVFRLEEDGAVINRYGFPSQGHSAVLARLRSRLPTFLGGPKHASLRDGSVLAVNLGKNKDSPVDSIEDFLVGVKAFGPYADVLVVNVSSPNTPGLRGLQNKDHLKDLLDSVVTARNALEPSPVTSTRPKIMLKVAPDLDEDQLVDMADVIRKSNIDGVIVSNTTIQRPNTLVNANKTETGGLSGPPIKPYSIKALQTLRTHLPATIPLIGCGGISTGKDALDYAKAGASMVQVYTSFGYDGVGFSRRIKDQLTEELAKEGKTWNQVVTDSVNALSWTEEKATLEEKKKKEEAVRLLITEAEELKTMIDQLGEKLKEDIVAT